MVKTIINEEVILSYPDGFEEMEGRSSIRAVTSAAASSARRSAARVVIDAIENSISFTNDKK